jgi:PAS domain-containing protein
VDTTLAELLIESLQMDFAFVRLCEPAVNRSTEVMRGSAWKAFPEWIQEHRAEIGRISRKEIILSGGDSDDSCRGLVIPIGLGGERGFIAVASADPDFPDQFDQQLLSVAANCAATAFRNAHLINELRNAQKVLRDREHELRTARDELETKVAERTSELRRSERELRDAVDTIPAVVWGAMPDGSNTYVNRRFLEYAGMLAEQLAGSGWHAATHR